MAQAPAGFALDTLLRKKVEKLRRKEKDARIHQRLSALLWLDQDYSAQQVADLLGVCPRTVQNWAALFRAGGLEALCTLEYKGDPGGLTAAQLDQLKHEVATGRFRCAAQACDWVEKTFGEGSPTAACASCSSGWAALSTRSAASSSRPIKRSRRS